MGKTRKKAAKSEIARKIQNPQLSTSGIHFPSVKCGYSRMSDACKTHVRRRSDAGPPRTRRKKIPLRAIKTTVRKQNIYRVKRNRRKSYKNGIVNDANTPLQGGDTRLVENNFYGAHFNLPTYAHHWPPAYHSLLFL